MKKIKVQSNYSKWKFSFIATVILLRSILSNECKDFAANFKLIFLCKKTFTKLKTAHQKSVQIR